GQAAAERAYHTLSQQDLQVQAIALPSKDPADTVQENPELLKTLLESGGIPYIELVLEQLKKQDLQSPLIRKQALHRLLELVRSLKSAVEREEYIRRGSVVFQTTETAMQADLAQAERAQPAALLKKETQPMVPSHPFSAMEITLGLFLQHPALLSLLPEMIPPEEDEFCLALYNAFLALPAVQYLSVTDLALTQVQREKASILHLFCEQNGFADWSESTAIREIRKNCLMANRDMLRHRQQSITKELILARAAGKTEEETALFKKYSDILKLLKQVG
ncbi:MAG: primase, partial [Candidatus Peribacteria bacterium]|nr:primase [Candidatus Peribacteria bacterium]